LSKTGLEMKIFLIFFISLAFVFSSAHAQFVGMVEVKMIDQKPKQADDDFKNPMMDSHLKEIKNKIREKEEKLKSLNKDDKEYKSLSNEIEIIKQQLGKLQKTDLNQEKPKEQISKFYLDVSQFRIESNDIEKENGNAILKMNRKIIIVIMDKEKKYIEIPFSVMREMAEKMKSMTNKNEIPKPGADKIKYTKEKKNILGYPCVKIITSDGENTSEAWITLKFSNFFTAFSELGDQMLGSSSDAAVMKELGSKGAFPMQIIEKSKNGEVISQWEVISIDNTKPDPSLFEPPKDYSKMDLMQMLKGKQ
jgi:hypothetical protein